MDELNIELCIAHYFCPVNVSASAYQSSRSESLLGSGTTTTATGGTQAGRVAKQWSVYRGFRQECHESQKHSMHLPTAAELRTWRGNRWR